MSPAGTKKNKKQVEEKENQKMNGYNAPTPVGTRPAAAATSVYAGINEAKSDTRFPWFQNPGRYLVTTVGWRGQKNFSGKFADVWDIQVVRVLRGGPGSHTEGDMLTRMRVQDQYNTWLSEVKTRAVVMLSIVNGVEIPQDQVTVETLGLITNGGQVPDGQGGVVTVEGNGALFRGRYVTVEVLPPKAKTRSQGDFTAFNYFIPTQAELEGL